MWDIELEATRQTIQFYTAEKRRAQSSYGSAFTAAVEFFVSFVSSWLPTGSFKNRLF